MDPRAAAQLGSPRPSVDDAISLELPSFQDSRGTLVAADLRDDLPFVPARLFAIHSVPEGATRADHANRRSAEVLVALSGRCTVVLHDGARAKRTTLDRADLGLHVPAGLWITCQDFTTEAVLLVLASAPYDPDDQIDDFDEYRITTGLVRE